MLNYKKFGEGKPIVILHGLLGSLDNWQTLARQLGEQYKVLIVDQRNHGKSLHSDEMDLHLMAQDVVEVLEKEGIEQAIWIGHSMGGKTVMQAAIDFPERISKIVVVDIAPKQYEPGHEVIFKALKNLDLDTLDRREEADKQLSKNIDDFGVRQFLLKNLDRTKDGFRWKMNLQSIIKNYDNILKAVVAPWPLSVPALFIRGEKSNYITDEDFVQIQELFPEAKLETVSDAGHWIHAEKPESFIQKLFPFLES